MKIIRLEAENFKRLKAVAITPTGNVVEVTGDNGEGKSSTLDAIWAALGGKKAEPAKPIRTGETSASIVLDLGKYKVTKRFRPKGDSYTSDLIVESAEGASFSSPQNMLNALVGEMCFDPLAFTHLKPEEQLVALRRFVPDVDFAQLEGLNKTDYDKRTDINRRAKDLRSQAAVLPAASATAPSRVDVAALEQKLADAARVNSDLATRKANREAAEGKVTDALETAKRLRNQIAILTEELDVADTFAKTMRGQIDNAAPLTAPTDTAEVQAALATARQTNATVDRIEERKKLEDVAAGLEQQAAQLTINIDTRKEGASKAVAAAAMPVKGITFGDGVVLLNGEPFEQSSMAEKIRTSVAIAAAMNPELRVARVMDGSLLDKKSWAILAEYADTHDLQIWVETVSQHGKSAILIEDGGVVSQEVPTPAAAEIGDVV